MERFAAPFAEALTQVLQMPVSSHELETPPDPKMGDFAFPCFKLAKSLRKAPPAIALDLKKTLSERLDSSVFQIEAVGPYVNATVRPEIAVPALLEEILSSSKVYGSLPERSRERWIFEYSSPNIAKPFMIGHLRTTVLGAALARMAKLRGYDAISINHLGDWGTQYGKLTVAYELYKNELPAEPSIDDLVSIYVRFHEAVEADPALEEKAREAFKKLEQGDKDVTALWERFKKISLREFERTYERLNVRFDHNWGESHYIPFVPKLIERLRASKLLYESEGAEVVDVVDEEGREIPPCIVLKKDGSTIYATRDLAAALYRKEKLDFERMTYVVGKEQRLHFQQVFGVLRALKEPWVDGLEHLAQGHYRFKGGKMSTRKGNFVTLNDVIDLARERTEELMTSRGVEMPPEVLQDAIERIAIGAVVFFDLQNDPVKDVDFEVERVVDFEGETGPYLQYAHTRCLSILRKAEETLGIDSNSLKWSSEYTARLQSAEEIGLVKLMGRFPLACERALEFRKPSHLCHYLIDLAKAFHSFYRLHKVVSEDQALTAARLRLVEATRRMLAQGLGLLGIPLPERM